MNILLIDTSTSTEILCLAHKGKYSQIVRDAGVSHSETIFQGINDLLIMTKTELKDLDAIATGVGPGSFTGIRIAVTTARMLAQILNIPLIGCKSTELMAAGSKAEHDDEILVAFDAKKQRVFGALYSTGKNTEDLKEIIVPGDYRIEDLLSGLDKNKTPVLIGDGIKRYQKIVEKHCSMKKYRVEIDFHSSNALSLVEKIYLNDQEKFKNFSHTVPFYARLSDAETLRDSKKITKRKSN